MGITFSASGQRQTVTLKHGISTEYQPCVKRRQRRNLKTLSQSTTNKMQSFSNLFISVRRSTCCRRFFRPSSVAESCTYSVRYLSPALLPTACLAGPTRLEAGSSNGLTNTRRCMCSFELLMMDRNLV